ncbi:MAG: ZIP family metal transporter [Firmicutes bacterium]|nr:ZIP family metal transporter [Bacillota bacterium]
MNTILWATLMGLMAGGLGTISGGLITVWFGRLREGLLSVILGFSGGIMLSIICFDLIPEAIRVAGLPYGLLGLIGGAIMLTLVDLYIPHSHETAEDKKSHFIRAGILLAIGLTMHSLPEGLAVGTSFAVGHLLGLKLTLIIALQKFPEGMAIAAPLLLGGISRSRTVLYTFLAGLPMGPGALLGILIGGISPNILSVALGFAGGTMLFITCDSLIPDAHRLSQGHTATFGIVTGVIVGIIFSYLWPL